MTNNTTYFNSTNDDAHDQRDVSTALTDAQLVLSVIAGLTVLIAVTSGLLNSFVLIALARVEQSTLKAKSFIQNCVVANMIGPITSTLSLPLAFSASGLIRVNFNLCFSAVTLTLFPVVGLVQAGCTICLTFDRIYVIAAPMSYGTVGYKGWIRTLMILAPWLVALLIWLIFICVSSASFPPTAASDMCQILHTANRMIGSTKIVDFYVTTINLLSFLLYIGIFIAIKYRRARIQKSSDSNLKRNNLSLAISYFLINVTTLCLYLPAPIYCVVALAGQVSFSNVEMLTMMSIERGMFLFFSCNSIVDPLILLFRVRSIRDNLPFCRPAGGEKRHRRK